MNLLANRSQRVACCRVRVPKPVSCHSLASMSRCRALATNGEKLTALARQARPQSPSKKTRKVTISFAGGGRSQPEKSMVALGPKDIVLTAWTRRASASRFEPADGARSDGSGPSTAGPNGENRSKQIIPDTAKGSDESVKFVGINGNVSNTGQSQHRRRGA
jgi:hypothetical protein